MALKRRGKKRKRKRKRKRERGRGRQRNRKEVKGDEEGDLERERPLQATKHTVAGQRQDLSGGEHLEAPENRC